MFALGVCLILMSKKKVYPMNPDHNTPWNKLAELQVLGKKEIKGRHYYINPALVEILSY